MGANPLQQARFRLGVQKLAQLPPDRGAEVAFAGRSNAGKSSALNALTGRRGLARTSKTPGRTQQINFFDLDPEHRLVDLPGYGYARVSRALQARWQALMAAYLEQRRSLKGLVLLTDVRHPLTEGDRQLLEWCRQARLPVHVLLTKADKLSRGRALAVLEQLKARLAEPYPELSMQLFSAQKKTGVDQARARVVHWLGLEEIPETRT